MTMQTCMELVGKLAPYDAEPALVTRLIGEIEGKVRVELLGEAPESLPDFSGEIPCGIALCVPAPFDRLYWLYVLAMLESLRGNVTRYENLAALFNGAYLDYGKWLKRRED
jgi:hypothetical protein